MFGLFDNDIAKKEKYDWSEIFFGGVAVESNDELPHCVIFSIAVHSCGYRCQTAQRSPLN